MDVLDKSGKTVHYSGKWEPVTFTSGQYRPNDCFRIYTENSVSLKVKGVGMRVEDAVVIGLTEGYHNLVCDRILEDGSDVPDGVFALF